MASCGGRLVTARPGRPGKSPARHYDLAARSSLHGSGRQMPAVGCRTAGAEGDGSAAPRPKIATVERREASVPRHGTQGASQAPGLPRHVQAPRVLRTHPNVSRRSAHPSIRVSEAKVKRPGRKTAPRERDGLFDIVRRSASAVAVIMPSPPAGEGDSMLPRAIMGEGSLLESNPSPIRVLGHTIVPSPARGEGTKGESCAFWRNEPNGHFGQTEPSGEHARERRTNLRLREMTAGVVSLFSACYLQ